MKTANTLSEKGIFKEKIHSALYTNENIRELLLGDTSGMSTKEIQDAFRDHVKSHLFIDDTIKETESFIFYDVVFPSLETNTKVCKVILYAISHRDILDNYVKDGYHGNRADILAEMIVDTLVVDDTVSNKFGIGRLTLDSIDLYNSTRFYGTAIIMTVPSFR
jgi:hypothetical protein